MPSNTDDYRNNRNFIYDSIIAKTSINSDDDEIDISAQIKLSGETLLGYVTLNWEFKSEIIKLINEISSYIDDKTIKRPLNILLNGDPGSGKSFFIDALVKKLANKKVEHVSFNMASLTKLDDFQTPLGELAGIKNSRIPLFYLDEFDSSSAYINILLPILWEGKFQFSKATFEREKLIIILSGSSSIIENMKKISKSMDKSLLNDDVSNTKEKNKIIDLLSRINGGTYQIPGLTKYKPFIVDRICIAVAILKKRFKTLEYVPWNLLKFVASKEFEYRFGARSIYTLLNLIPESSFSNGKIDGNKLNLPLIDGKRLWKSVLSYHLIPYEVPQNIIDSWLSCSSYKYPVKVY